MRFEPDSSEGYISQIGQTKDDAERVQGPRPAETLKGGHFDFSRQKVDGGESPGHLELQYRRHHVSVYQV